MLVEPGMLLIARSAETGRAWMTDLLIEYLDNYARQFDPTRQDEAFLSIQRVLVHCERLGVVKSIRDLINNPNLKTLTQSKIKTFYKYSNIIEEKRTTRLTSEEQQPVQTADAFAEDEEMADAGNFSPPHVQDAGKSPEY